MAQITASLVKDLREASGAGMMDCKKALQENDGDFEAAKDWLRKKGIANAGKKASRIASEGLVAIATKGNEAAIIEFNSETDFVAKNEQFQILAKTIAGVALTEKSDDIETIKQATEANSGKTVETLITDAIATIGENMSLRRAALLSVDNGVIASYVHNSQAPNLGKIGVLVAVKTDADASKALEFGKQIAMHVAAAKPSALNRKGVDASLLEREREIFSEQARNSGKPENIIEKMVEGRIRKFYEEIVLLEQAFVIDGKTKVEDVIAEKAKELGNDIAITGYVQFTLGEGIEKEESDFAAEVAAAASAA